MRVPRDGMVRTDNSIFTVGWWSARLLLFVCMLLRSAVAPIVCRCRRRLCHDRICVHIAVNVTTADTCIHVRISSAHANSNMNTDTVMIEPSSSSAPANNRGNSAPQ